MNLLLYNRGSYLSARLLATLLGLKPVNNPDRVRDGKVCIRYGNSYGDFDQDTNINSSEAIKLCSNSLNFSHWCVENGFNTPEYSPFSLDDSYEYPFLLRNIYHKQGKDIEIIKSSEDINDINRNKYHVPYIQADIELGIHLVNQEVVKIFKKVPNQENETFIKNQKSCHFKVVNDIENNFRVAQEICKNLFQKLNLNFGRVDIAYNNNTKKYIIWEVNTAPGLNKLTAEIYAKVLRELINV